ncbi:MAG: hypothetical protein KF900_09905 [Bacteroidetes bacterium]|nr:hypothetical protein [Bacteroidota bacterium]
MKKKHNFTGVISTSAFILWALMLLTAQKGFSQLFSKDKNEPVFRRENAGKMLPATILYPDGKTEQVTVKMQLPEQLKKTDNTLEIEKSGTPSKITSGTLEAFSVDGNLWAKRAVPISGVSTNVGVAQNFVVLTRQGGIQQYYYVTIDYKENNVVVGKYVNKITWKAGEKAPGTNYAEMIADCEELKGSLRKDNSNLDSVLTLYNIWYEKQNPGQVKYIFANGPLPMPKTGASANEFKDFKDMKAQMKREKEIKDSIRTARMASRPSTPDPGIASKKPNLPPKKETFSAKVKRLESEGNKIGVTIEFQKTIIRTLTPGGACVEGAKEKDFEDENYAAFVVSKLNELYQTTIFEAVDASQVPLKQVKSFSVDDWWSTCYKVLVSLNQSRVYSATINQVSGENEVQYFINNKATVMEFIDDGKNKTDYLKRMYSMGDGYSNAVKYKDCGTMEKFEEMTDTKQALERFEKSQTEKFAKLVDKWD